MKNMIIDNVRYYKEEVLKINEKAKILAVSKTIEPYFVNIAMNEGLHIVGENRVQELLSKWQEYQNADIHFIGHLQTNKVKNIIDKVSMIQSVDSLKLAETISRYSLDIGQKKDILIQINVSKEDSKSGIDIEKTNEYVSEISQLSGVNIRGFMTIPKNANDYELEVCFDKMNQVFSKYEDFDILSMGMSRDFKLALKHGSTMVRVGSGIFKKNHP